MKGKTPDAIIPGRAEKAAQRSGVFRCTLPGQMLSLSASLPTFPGNLRTLKKNHSLQTCEKVGTIFKNTD